MKTSRISTSPLTTAKKTAAKAGVLQSLLTSFKIEGVTFSQKQIESIKSRVQLI